MEPKPKPHREFGSLLTEGIKQLALARRTSIGLVHEELAQKLGYATNTIHVWRRGEHLPEPEVVETLTRLFVQTWQADQQWVNKFLEKGQYGPAHAVASLNEELFATNRATPTRGGVEFFIEALQSWSEDFFRWSKASDHMRSSWAGMVIYTMSAITDRITPRGALVFFVALSLWVVTAWLIAPVLRWPLDETTRWITFIKYGAATLLIPLLVALVTQPDRYTDFDLKALKQHATLWFLKLTGALVGFYTFSMVTIGLALIWYYLGRSPFSIEMAGLLSTIPLFLSYVTARRIPADRYKMFNRELRAHSADYLFFGVFLFIGPLTALFFYFYYWFLSDRTVAPLVLLLILIGITLWEYKKQG